MVKWFENLGNIGIDGNIVDGIIKNKETVAFVKDKMSKIKKDIEYEILSIEDTIKLVEPDPNVKQDTYTSNPNVKQDTSNAPSSELAKEETLYVDLNPTNANMMVSTIKLNNNFKKYTKKNGVWDEEPKPKGGTKRKSKSIKKARRSK
jgi:hypothetical protein